MCAYREAHAREAQASFGSLRWGIRYLGADLSPSVARTHSLAELLFIAERERGWPYNSDSKHFFLH